MNRLVRPLNTLGPGLGLLSGLILALLASEYPVHASAFYYEFQGGFAQIRNSEPFFTGTPSILDRGFSLNGSFGYSFSGGAIPAEAQIGLQHRTVTGSVNSMEYYAIQAPYLIARLQLSRIFVGAGFAPFVWRRVGPMPGLDAFSGAPGSRAFLGEGGFLWPAAAQFITTDGVLSPKPTGELTVLMRVYFGFSRSSSSSDGRDTSNEFHGWRYPFGVELRN